MAGARVRTLWLAAAAMLAVWAAPAHALLGISLPSNVSLLGLAPNHTATATGVSVAVTGVVTPWAMTVAPSATATPGHLRATSGTCTGSEDALASPLHMDISSTLGTATIDKPSYDVQSGTVQIAHGSLADTLTVLYSQPVGATEGLRQGCVYSIDLTFTVS